MDSFCILWRRFGELWPSSYRDLEVSLDPLKCTFWDIIFRPLGGCCALKFLHALQIDQALPAHTRTGREFPIKFQSWKFKIWPKIHRVSPCNFRASGSIPTKLFPDDVPRVRGDKIGISFGRKACPLKFGRAKKRPKFGAIVDKFQLWSRISSERINISQIRKVFHQLHPLPS